jgi:hypothetical protein
VIEATEFFEFFLKRSNPGAKDSSCEVDASKTKLGIQATELAQMPERRRIKHTESLENRLANQARRLREEASQLRPGPKRDELIRRARQAETGSHLSEWLRSPGLQPPR